MGGERAEPGTGRAVRVASSLLADSRVKRVISPSSGA